MIVFPTSFWGGIEALTYFLNATFDAANQTFSNGQILDTEAEGVQDGQFEVVETSTGSVKIVSNRLEVVSDGGTGWNNTGVIGSNNGAAFAKTLGLSMIWVIQSPLASEGKREITGFVTTNALGNTSTAVYTVGFIQQSNAFDAWFHPGGITTSSIQGVVNGITVDTDFHVALVLGGYNINGVPYYAGQNKADYIYGCTMFAKGGGILSTWTMVYRFATGNDASLYSQHQTRNLDNVKYNNSRIPDKDLSVLLEPTHYSSFNAANGTTIESLTPEVGNVWTTWSNAGGTWTNDPNACVVQNNKAEGANAASDVYNWMQTVNSDVWVRGTFQISASNTNQVGPVVRITDRSNHWSLQITASVPELRLVEVNAGTVTIRASVSNSFSINTDYDLVLRANGQKIDGWIGGAGKLSYASATFNELETQHGFSLRGRDDLSNVGRCDDLHVHAITKTEYDTELDAV